MSVSPSTVKTSKVADVVVRAQNLEKVYRVWDSPRARMKNVLAEWASGLSVFPKSISSRLQRVGMTHARDFHALSDLNFEIRRGESVGIVGRNGSGKSTLLQLISGILKPTAGSLHVDGSVAALLELGSGFSPEFTGRENVYLGCSLMGMSRSRVDEEYDNIADFADIGEFIDQPVRTYSSGMLLRLAFAVQTAVEPDLLIVDEALSVGDVFFQAKCMRRMRRLVERGVTVMIVSHSMPTVKEFCDRALLLDHGRLVLDANPGQVAARYFSLSIDAGESELVKKGNKAASPDERWTDAMQEQQGSVPANEPAGIQTDIYAGRDLFERKAADERIKAGNGGFLNVQLMSASGELRDTFDYDEPVVLRMILCLDEAIEDLIVAYHIRTPAGVDLIHGDTRFHRTVPRTFQADRIYLVDWRFRLRLMHGSYVVNGILSLAPQSSDEPWRFVDYVPYALGFTVAPRKAGMFGGFVVWDDEVDVSTFGAME